jgi:Mg2+ and Co2+ transporter CorA
LLQVYRDTGTFLSSPSAELPGEIIWMDLLTPTPDERALAESRAKIRVPSIEALSEIEASSRLASDEHAIYLSLPVVARGDTPDAYQTPLGLILTRQVLMREAELVLLACLNCAADAKQNQTLRRRQRQVGLGLQATGHQHERPFREARQIATMCLKFGVHLGNPR